MRRLIIHGDPGIRKGAVVEIEGEELTCFSVTRNGDWHGPDRVQLWCIAGESDERDAFERQEFVPHFLDVQRVEADDVAIIQSRGVAR